MNELRFHTTQNDPADYRADVISDNAVIGKVNIRWNYEKGFYEDWYELEVSVEDIFLEETLRFCLEKAFEEFGAANVHADCEGYRDSAVSAYYHAGFVIESKERHISHFVITEKQYYRD